MKYRRQGVDVYSDAAYLTRHHGVFGIEIETCEQRGGKVRVIESIEDPVVTGKVLGHRPSQAVLARIRPPSRARHRAGWGFSERSEEPARPDVTGPGVVGCAEHCPRCANPALTGRFAGQWIGSVGGGPARRQWRPGLWAGRLSQWGI